MTIALPPETTRLGVVGTGTMGQGIAQIAAAAGYHVVLADAKPGATEMARGFIAKMLRRAAEKGWTTSTEAEAAIGRVAVASDLADLKDCVVIVEAIVEDLEVKRTLFVTLEGIVGANTILATNTSSLIVTDVAAACKRPERVVGAHFFNPVPLMKLVEIVDGERTDPAVGDAMMALFTRMGHKTVRVKDSPGFLVNFAGRGFSTEALAVLAEGAVSFVDVDRVMRDCCGFPMGPFELFDLTALDVSHRSMESSFRQYYGEPRFRPSTETARRMAAGLLGRKSGRGFYSYTDGKRQDLPESATPSVLPKTVWVSPKDRAARQRVLDRLKALGRRVKIETGAKPKAKTLCLITPFGQDTTTAALALGLDPARTLAIDTVHDMQTRVTLMASPATTPQARDEAHGLFAAAGAKVTLIADSPGFIAQRILASIVNIGCVIAQNRISAPEEIDPAVRIGRGYRQGPLELGDSIGPARVLEILENLQAATGDPRYRPSLWLRRRAVLGVPLKTPDLIV